MLKIINSFIFLMLVLVATTSCQKKTCADFKLGKFEANDTSISDIKITRTETEQIEVSQKRGFKDVYKILWANECEYHLVLKESNNPDKNLLNDLDTLKVSITAIEEDTYQFTAVLNGKAFMGDLKQTSIKTN